MTVKTYNQNGTESGDMKLPKEIFEVPMNLDLVYQVVSAKKSAKRKPIAKAKNRAEVRGGGRKPWRQKGTGRARHGSIRSPLWKGGGVTFGPLTEKVFEKKITKKMQRKALFMVLSAKVKEKTFLVVEDLKIEEPKTKIMAGILRKLFLDKGTGLVALDKKDDRIIRTARNIEGVKAVLARNLNILDLLSYQYLLIPKESVKVIQETFAKPESSKSD